MNIGLGKLAHGIFNVADVVILIGVRLLGLSVLGHTGAGDASCP